MNSIEKTGKTVEEAKENVLKELNIDNLDKLKWEILEEPTSGIFGIGTKEAKVRAVVKDKTEKKSESESSAVDVKAKEVLNQIIKYLGIQVDFKEQKEEDRITIDITGSDIGILIGKRGQTLKALQFLINIIINKSAQTHQYVLLDAEGYRAKREQALKDLASKLALNAVKENRDVFLDPMSASERRIIHVALADHPEAETHSLGEEPFRKVVISPKKGSSPSPLQ